MKHVIKGVHAIPMGMANAFLIDGDDGLTLIDAGYPHKEAAVFGAIRAIGRLAGQLKNLIFTHGHPDHIGSAAAIVRETGARTYMHPLDIPMAESGGPFRPLRAAPGLLRRVLCRLLYRPDERLEPVAIDQPLTPGEILPIAGGIEVIHAPGHCAGQVALLWPLGRMLFAGDVRSNIMGLGDPLGFESLEEGRASQRKLAGLSFDAAGFGHGGPIIRDASAARLESNLGFVVGGKSGENLILGITGDLIPSGEVRYTRGGMCASNGRSGPGMETLELLRLSRPEYCFSELANDLPQVSAHPGRS
jgi:glyoxylase-like metal-dependent hydrolase (beta-lactamase superfamily II)